GHEHVVSDLSLDAQVPLVDVRRLEMQGNADVLSALREGDVAIKRRGVRISTWKTLPWIPTRRVGDINLETPRRRISHSAHVLVEVRRVVENSIRCTDRHPPVAPHIPRHSKARCEILPTRRTGERSFGCHSGIAREQHTD